MNRRRFGLLSAASAASSPLRPAMAQPSAPDASLLSTVLTPLGGTRAGNADGSIPAWTGGVVSPPLPPDQPVDVNMFEDEQPLYTVNADNMAQYRRLLSAGTAGLISRHGFSLKVYRTHRTAAAPQYIYDNTARNVTRAKFLPQGGRFGFTGGYGGPPFPIIDTSDPFTAGAQIIWNHLVSWDGYAKWTTFAPGFVVANHQRVLSFGGSSHFICPYYDPKGSPETYQGYYSKLHEFFKAPPGSNGQEAIVWHSSNVLEKPDITWALVNGQGRVRKAPDEAYDTPNPSANGINNYDDASGFAGSPQRYDWKLIGRREMLVPYNCNGISFSNADEFVLPAFPNPDLVRWEKHRMWVVEATLHPGEQNTTKRRMCYMDEDTWYILLADCYDAQNSLVKTTMVYNICSPSLPGTVQQGYAAWNMMSGDYTYIGTIAYPPYPLQDYYSPQPASLFNPEQMAATSSF